MTRTESSARPVFGRIWVLMVTVFVDMIGFFMVLPLLPFYAERLGATAFLVGVLVAAFAVAQFASAPFWGRFSDQVGRRPALLVGLFASAAAFLLFGVAESLTLLLVSRLVQGLGGGTTGVVQAYVSDVVRAGERTQALGWISAATSAGVMVGPVFGSLAALLGPRAPGFLAAALCLLNVWFALRWLPESRAETPSPGVQRERILGTLHAVVRNPGSPSSVLIWMYALGMMAFMAMNGVLALFLERRFGIDEASIGYIYFYFGGLSLLMRALILGWALRLFGELGVLRLGATCLTLGFALIPLPDSIWLFAPVAALMPIGTALLFPATSSLVTRHAPEGQTGQLLGVQQFFGGLSRMSGPVWAGLAFERLSIEAPFHLASLLALAVAGLALFAVRVPEVEEEVVPPVGRAEGSPGC